MLWLVEGACLRRASRIRVLSHFSAEQLWQLYRVPADRIVKVPGGMDAERFRPAADRLAVRKALGLPGERPVLLTVRNLEARMGLDTLIRAMAGVVRHRPDALLLVGGTGSLRAPLEALAASLGLTASVRFLGYVPEAELPRHYQAADLFVLPTRELEGFGLVTLESLACGTPAIGTPVGGTPELLAPIDQALLADAPSAEALARALLAFFARADHDALAARCRAHTEAYAWDRIAERLETELTELRAG